MEEAIRQATPLIEIEALEQKFYKDLCLDQKAIKLSLQTRPNLIWDWIKDNCLQFILDNCLQKEEGWINVDKGLPTERMLQVLIFNGKAKEYSQCVLHATWFLESNKFKINSDTVITYNDITHWKPLPQPPTK